MRCKQNWEWKQRRKIISSIFYNNSFLIRISNFSPNYTPNNYDNLIDVIAFRVSKDISLSIFSRYL